MSPKLEIARHRIEYAHEALQDADILIAARRWRGALNRLCYAAFYAARALLATRDLDSSGHSGVIALFQQHFVKTGIVPASVARALPRSFESRQTSDYADAGEPNEEDIRAFRTDIEAFVVACRRVVEQTIAREESQG